MEISLRCHPPPHPRLLKPVLVKVWDRHIHEMRGQSVQWYKNHGDLKKFRRWGEVRCDHRFTAHLWWVYYWLIWGDLIRVKFEVTEWFIKVSIISVSQGGWQERALIKTLSRYICQGSQQHYERTGDNIDFIFLVLTPHFLHVVQLLPNIV